MFQRIATVMTALAIVGFVADVTPAEAKSVRRCTVQRGQRTCRHVVVKTHSGAVHVTVSDRSGTVSGTVNSGGVNASVNTGGTTSVIGSVNSNGSAVDLGGNLYR